jgi:antitoxin component YwqK of YwqJK toxin-antitoxin module
MKTFALILLIFSFLVSCSGSDKDIDESNLIEKGEINTIAQTDTCSCDSLLTDTEGNFTKNGEVFTGICTHNYPNSDLKYMVKSILKGKLHGSISYYDREGELLMTEVYSEGERKNSGVQTALNCDCSELKATELIEPKLSQYFLNEVPFNGKCIEKYPNSEQIYMEITYLKGFLHGFTTYFDKQGKVMYMEKYENGVLQKVIQSED